MAKKGLDYVKRYSRFKKRSEPVTLSQTRNFANCENGWRLIFFHNFSSRKLFEPKIKGKKKRKKICTMKVFKCSRQLEKSFSPRERIELNQMRNINLFPSRFKNRGGGVQTFPPFSPPSFCLSQYKSSPPYIIPSFCLRCNFAVLAFIRVALNNTCFVQQVMPCARYVFVTYVLATCIDRSLQIFLVHFFFFWKLFLDNLSRIIKKN